MATSGKGALRVLAADDSAVMREILRMVFSMHGTIPQGGLPPMELCGVARDGIEALESVRTLQPDVLVLDLEMPRLNGLGVLDRLRDSAPSLPVIMCSAHTERGARATLDALSSGAKDYVMKPSQQTDFAGALDSLMRQLLPRIAALAPAGFRGPEPMAEKSRREPAVLQLRAVAAEGRPEILVIGVSTGGPAALEQLLPALPANLPVPVLIVQHMPRLFTGALAARLDKLCALKVREAADGMLVERGQVLLAPGDAHMEVCQGAAQARAIRLHQGPALNSCKPSADYLFQSAARLFGSSTLALVLTGMGQDGFTGAEAVVQTGGVVLAQDEATSAVWGMPGRVARAGLAAETLPLGKLAAEIKRRVLHRAASGKVNFNPVPQASREPSYGMQ